MEAGHGGGLGSVHASSQAVYAASTSRPRFQVRALRGVHYRTRGQHLELRPLFCSWGDTAGDGTFVMASLSISHLHGSKTVLFAKTPGSNLGLGLPKGVSIIDRLSGVGASAGVCLLPWG